MWAKQLYNNNNNNNNNNNMNIRNIIYNIMTLYMSCARFSFLMLYRCWLSSKEGVIFAFIAPMVAILIVSLSCFLLCSVHIVTHTCMQI